MTSTSAGMLMMLGAVAMLAIAWGPLFFQNRQPTHDTAPESRRAAVTGSPSRTMTHTLESPQRSAEVRDDYDEQTELGSFKARTLAHPVDDVRIWWKPARTLGVLRVQISSGKEELVRFVRNPKQIALDGAGYLTLDDLRYRLADDRSKAEQLLQDIDAYCPSPGQVGDTQDPSRSDDSVASDNARIVGDEGREEAVPVEGSSRQEPATVEGAGKVSEAARREAVQRLRELKSLHDEGVLTDDEYQRKRQHLVDMI